MAGQFIEINAEKAIIRTAPVIHLPLKHNTGQDLTRLYGCKL